MPMTPAQWLERLTKALDDRRPRLALLRSYMDGNAPLPEGADGCRDAYKEFQKKARTNFGEVVVDAVCERMIPAGLYLGDEPQDDDALRLIWKRSWLQTGISDVLRDMVGLSAGYVMVSGTAGAARVTCERPEQVITEQDAGDPLLVRAALKVYRDPVEKLDHAYLHLPGTVYHLTRKSTWYFSGKEAEITQAAGGWDIAAVEAQPTGLEFVPVFPLLNRGGKGEFETHVDVLDRINWDILQRLVIIAMQAYRQRGVKGDLPPQDEDGNTIDYAEMFKPGPGALWRLPEGVELWESQQTDGQWILAACKDDLTHLSAVTRTPMGTLMPGQSENQSAEGAAFAREGLVFKTTDRIERAKAQLSRAMGGALAIDRGESSIVEGVDVAFGPPERQSLAEKADAGSKAQDLPWRTRMTDIWGYSADRVDAMESERAADALNAALSRPQPPAQVTRASEPVSA